MHWIVVIDELKYTVAAISKLQHLEMLDLYVHVGQFDLEGARLVQLAALKNLNTVWISTMNPGTVRLTGAQLAAFLSELPRLDDLSLDLGMVELLCLPNDNSIIDATIAKMKEVELGGLTVSVQYLPSISSHTMPIS